jgi:hypothetical protein
MKADIPGVAALALVALAATGCGSATDGSDHATGFDRSDVAAAPSPSAATLWACDARAQNGFATDPVVYPVEVPLSEVAAQVPDAESFDVERHGRAATVTYRDADGLIVHRFEYSRGVETGWRLERGHTCSL